MEVTASSFEDTFCGFLTMTHEIDSLANLGALVDVNGPFVKILWHLLTRSRW